MGLRQRECQIAKIKNASASAFPQPICTSRKERNLYMTQVVSFSLPKNWLIHLIQVIQVMWTDRAVTYISVHSRVKIANGINDR